MLRALVDLVHEGAHGNAAREQHFGDVPAGLALPAAGGGGDENGFCHGRHLRFLWVAVWYRAVPMDLNVWYP